VEATAFAMQPGQISGPVPSPAGVVVIQVTAAEAARPLTDNMRQAVKQQLFFDWLQAQRSAAKIEVYIAQ
jgi:parvulin-like peptidyl-prolyl isomerase